MTRFFFFLTGIFFSVCKLFWVILAIIFDTCGGFCDRAEDWCEERRACAIKRLQKPIHQNVRRVL